MLEGKGSEQDCDSSDESGENNGEIVQQSPNIYWLPGQLRALWLWLWNCAPIQPTEQKCSTTLIDECLYIVVRPPMASMVFLRHIRSAQLF